MTATNLPKYTVKQAAQLTGISINQIRLWERRYGLVKPSRAENGYRLYTDEDLNLLRFVLKERSKGISMQVIMSLTRSEMIQHFLKDKDESEVIKSDMPEMKPFITALKTGKANLFESHLLELQSGLSFLDAIKQNDLKILCEIGQLEHEGKLDIPCSHIASAVIRKRILSHVQNIGIYQTDHPVILAGFQGDYHEIGLLASLLEFVHLQIPVMYLGSNVPIEELISFSKKIQPRGIIISVCNTYSARGLKELIYKYQELSKTFNTWFGGYEVDKNQAYFHSKGLRTLNDISETVNFLGLNN